MYYDHLLDFFLSLVITYLKLSIGDAPKKFYMAIHIEFLLFILPIHLSIYLGNSLKPLIISLCSKGLSLSNGYAFSRCLCMLSGMFVLLQRY